MKLQFHAGLASCGVLALSLISSASSQSGAKAASGDFTLIRDAAQSLVAGDLKRAENELNIALAAAPDDVRALNLLGIVYAQQKRESEAEGLFKRAIILKPDFASAHVSLGMLYAQMAKPDRAIPEFQNALQLDPGRRMPSLRSSTCGASKLARKSVTATRKRHCRCCCKRARRIRRTRMCSLILVWLRSGCPCLKMRRRRFARRSI